ncbi:MAG: hypothetical protein HC866_10595 [Leptolyngbyaceae cyanobacterium RU_5_1]|nr:hypothetical protein [Leptolyngbyaceae cyanobacterium RU_5_1]
MVIFVVITNVLIGLVCLFIAWKVGQFRRTLARATDTLLSVEQAIHHVLYPAPDAIRKGQVGTNQLRQRYQQLGLQLERVQRILSLLSLGQILWRRRGGMRTYQVQYRRVKE